MIEKKTETASFRLEKKQLEQLRKESETNFISLNSLVSQIFAEHIGWYSKAAKAGFVPLPKPLLIKIMNKLSKDEIINVAEYMANKEVKNIILMLRKEYQVDSFLDVLEFWIKSCNFPYDHENDNGRHKYVITHEMGEKWSLYLGSVFKFIFNQLKIQQTEFEISENTIVIMVSVSKKEVTTKN